MPSMFCVVRASSRYSITIVLHWHVFYNSNWKIQFEPDTVFLNIEAKLVYTGQNSSLDANRPSWIIHEIDGNCFLKWAEDQKMTR